MCITSNSKPYLKAKWLLSLAPVKCLGCCCCFLNLSNYISYSLLTKMDEMMLQSDFLTFNCQHLWHHDKPYHWFICLLTPLIWQKSQLIMSLFYSSKNLSQNPSQYNIEWR